MKAYSDLAPRRAAQVGADTSLVLWSVLWSWAGTRVHDAALALADPGHRLVGAGGSFRTAMDEAATAARDVPLLPDAVGAPFGRAASVGRQIEDAGRGLVTSVERLALLLGWTTALLPVVLALLVWLATRGRWVRAASAAQRFVDADADLDLFALRALAAQPLHRLAAISDDPAGAWRRAEPGVVRALAELELGSVGLRPPPPRSVAGDDEGRP